MKLNDFILKWQGKFCEVTGSPGATNQCVDICNAYIRDVLGFPIIEWTNARDFPTKAGNNYDYIGNTPFGIPQEGDLVIWNNTTAGHIAIFIEGNVDSFRSFDQNYPTGTPCHIQNHTYSGVGGWLHPKLVTEATTVPSTNVQSVDQIIIDGYLALCGEGPTDDEKSYRLEHWTNTVDFLKSLTGDSRFSRLYIDPHLVEKNAEITRLNDFISRDTREESDFGSELHETQKELEEAHQEYHHLVETLELTQSELDECRKEVTEWKNSKLSEQLSPLSKSSSDSLLSKFKAGLYRLWQLLLGH